MRYFVAVASREHVEKGVEGCFAQACHGKRWPMLKMTAGDRILYYSPTEKFRSKAPCRKFTAAGTVREGQAYTFEMEPGFVHWRRDVDFENDIAAVDLSLVVSQMHVFSGGNPGLILRRGFFEIDRKDFDTVYRYMKRGQ